MTAGILTGAAVFAVAFLLGWAVRGDYAFHAVKNLRDDYDQYPADDAEQKGRFDALYEAAKRV